tara:strand:- start:271 stop:480 length:210 start_codon:yes stop_codon:yes gene_type:complete
MPRKQKRPVVEEIRRKCAACGKIKVVKFREWKIPETKFNPNKGGGPLRKDIPGAVVTNYCSYECGGQVD